MPTLPASIDISRTLKNAVNAACVDTPTAAGRPWRWISVQSLVTWLAWWIGGYPGIELVPQTSGLLGLLMLRSAPVLITEAGTEADRLCALALAADVEAAESGTPLAKARSMAAHGAAILARAIERNLVDDLTVADALWAEARNYFLRAGTWVVLSSSTSPTPNEAEVFMAVRLAREHMERQWHRALELEAELSRPYDLDALRAVVLRRLDALAPGEHLRAGWCLAALGVFVSIVPERTIDHVTEAGRLQARRTDPVDPEGWAKVML